MIEGQDRVLAGLDHVQELQDRSILSEQAEMEEEMGDAAGMVVERAASDQNRSRRRL